MQRRGFLAATASALVLHCRAESALAVKLQLPPGRDFGDAVNSLAVLPNGHLLVAHTGGVAGVAEFSATGRWIADWAPEFASQGQCVIVSDSHIWIAGHAARQLGGVSKFSLDGKPLGTWKASGVTSLAVTPQGTVLVSLANEEFHGIARLDFPNETHRFGHRGRGEGKFRYPQLVAFHADTQQLEILDTSNQRTVWTTPEGKFLKTEPATAKNHHPTVKWQGKVWTAEILPGRVV